MTINHVPSLLSYAKSAQQLWWQHAHKVFSCLGTMNAQQLWQISCCLSVKKTQQSWWQPMQVSCCLSIKTTEQLWWRIMQISCCLTSVTIQQLWWQHTPILNFSWLLVLLWSCILREHQLLCPCWLLRVFIPKHPFTSAKIAEYVVRENGRWRMMAMPLSSSDLQIILMPAKNSNMKIQTMPMTGTETCNGWP